MAWFPRRKKTFATLDVGRAYDDLGGGENGGHSGIRLEGDL